jgi:hypothetical protein
MTPVPQTTSNASPGRPPSAVVAVQTQPEPLLHPERMLVQRLGQRPVADVLQVCEGAPDHPVERDEDRELKQKRSAAAKGIHAMLLVQLHELLVGLLAIALVLLLHTAHLRLDALHLAHGLGLLYAEGQQHEPHDYRQQDYREPVVPHHAVDSSQAGGEDLEEGEVHGVPS